jgi:hypothetical protein
VKHLLLSKAKRFPAGIEPKPRGWQYSRTLSVWIADGEDGTERPPKPTSKKADVETGEDMKGT